MSSTDKRNVKEKCENVSKKNSTAQDSLEFYEENHRFLSMPNYFSKAKYVLSDEQTDDGNESDVSSSFSLQECMNEFSARRNRRTLLYQQRQNGIKGSCDKNLQEATELDLINQNLCNKEQERKFKPCRNGFCYCFTSDSGDDGCQILGAMRTNNLLSRRRSTCLEVLNTNKIPLCKKELHTPTNNLTAITSIEQNKEKSPIIHIIHEIHAKKVISKVKFGKTEFTSLRKLVCRNRKTEEALPKVSSFKNNAYIPSAPKLDFIYKKNNANKKLKPIIPSKFSENRRHLGGQLLQKRFCTQLTYKQKYLEKIKADRPRILISSTDTSVNKTEQFFDDVLLINGNELNATTLTHNSNSIKYEIATNSQKTDDEKKFYSISNENVIPSCPFLCDDNELKNISHDKNLLTDDLTEEVGSGFNEIKMRDMFNFDSNIKIAKFRTNSWPAEITKDIPINDKITTWKPTHKINLDAVDGAVHHNLASNFIDKSTPVKGQIAAPNQQNCFWSEKLKHLSPWSNKTIKKRSQTENEVFPISKSFIKSSKTKLLNLISPRKDQRNRKSRNFFRNFGVQISNSFPQRGAGNCNSQMQSCYTNSYNQCSPSNNILKKTKQAVFDFSRTVHSPNKAALRGTSQRKLDFPLNSALKPLKDCEKKTYRSFNSELDQDIPISKISYILDNIRSKLEVTDQRAACTYQEYIVDQNSIGFDCPDNPHKQQIEENDPIYSEILDENIYLSNGPDLDNHSGIQHYGPAGHPEILYTKVNKRILDKKELHLKKSAQQIPLGNKLTNKFTHPNSVEKKQSLPFSSNSPLSHCQSVNSIQLVKPNLYPNTQRNRRKSDLSLQRSDFFLDNLYSRELVADPDCGRKIIEDNESIMHGTLRGGAETKYNACQSTSLNLYNMWIPIKKCQPRSLSINDTSYYESYKKSTIKDALIMNKCKSLNKFLRKSFRKSKGFVREKGKSFSKSMNFATSNLNVTSGRQSYSDLDSNREELIAFNESANMNQQIAQAVNVCRQFPNLEASMEMVEAERLLLFSSLSRKNYPTERRYPFMNQKSSIRFVINEMHLPVSANVSHDSFFNFFYIVTFECDDVVRSSQSAESRNGVTVFRDDCIEFISNSEFDANTLNEMTQHAVKCNIFMLRLRKLSTVLLEQKKEIIECDVQTPSTTPKSTRSASSSSSCGTVSRFRLQASFSLHAKDFSPYEYVHQEVSNCDRICIRSSCRCTLPLEYWTKSTNLLGEIQLKGEAEIYLPKLYCDGFLDVQDPYKQHIWNRRYCHLDGIFFRVWQDKSGLRVNSSPIVSIDLRNCKYYENYPLACSPREMCARPRSFYLDWESEESSKSVSLSPVFFSADTQKNLQIWLKNLNIIMNFIFTWLK